MNTTGSKEVGAQNEGRATSSGAATGLQSQETEIDLIELVQQFVRHIKLILLLTVLGALLSAAYTFWMVTPIYESTAKMYILNSSGSIVNLSDLQIGSYLANDYMEFFKTREVHQTVASNLGLKYSVAQMQGMLTVENPKDTRMLYITVKSPDPKEAAAMANEYASVAIKYIASTMATEEPNMMSTAIEAKTPSSPSKTRNIAIGLMLGLFLALGWITVRFLLDDKVKTVDDIRKYTALSVLAVVPAYQSANVKDGKKPKRGEKA